MSEQPADLFAMAAANGTAVQRRFEELLGGLPPSDAQVAQEFADTVQADARISLNQRPEGLSSFLTSGVHRNAHEQAEHEAWLFETSPDEMLRLTLGPYYERRTSFDDHFRDGRRFRYGALNAGGPGLTRFGQFCAVLAERVPADPAKAAYLPEDSLHGYVESDDTVNEAKLRRDVAPHWRRGALAALKHQGDLARTPPEAWGGVLCSDAAYVEAVFLGEVTPDDLECVRVTKSQYEALAHLAFDDFRRKLSRGEQAILAHFRTILAEIRNRGLTLERI